MLGILPFALIKHHKMEKPKLPQKDNIKTGLVQAGKVGEATQANIGYMIQPISMQAMPDKMIA